MDLACRFFPCGSGSHWELALAFAEAEQQVLESCAAKLYAEAEEIQVCAESYRHDDLGDPRKHLMREANHLRRAAAALRESPEPEEKP